MSPVDRKRRSARSSGIRCLSLGLTLALPLQVGAHAPPSVPERAPAPTVVVDRGHEGDVVSPGAAGRTETQILLAWGSDTVDQRVLAQLRSVKGTRGVNRTQTLRNVWVRFSPDVVVATLKAMVKTGDDEDLLLVVETILRGGPNVQQVLVELLSDPSPILADRIEQTLWCFGPRAKAPFEAALRSGDPAVQLRAIHGLSRVGDARDAERLATFAGDPDPALRRAAVEALGAMAPEIRGASLARFARDEVSAIRLRVAEFYAQQGGAGAAEALNLLAVDSDDDVRVAAIAALREQAVAGVAALGMALNDPVAAIRAEASRGIAEQSPGQQGIALIENQDPVVHDAAIEALLAKPDAPVAVFGAMATVWDTSIRRQALERIAQSRDEDAGLALQAFLDDPDPSLQQSAVRILARREAAHNPALLAPVAKLDNPEAQRIAVEALIQAGTPDATKALTEFVRRGDETIRRQALSQLTRMPISGTLTALAWAIHDPDPAVRRSALHAIARQPERESIGLLAEFLTDASPLIRKEAALALGYRQTPDAALALSRCTDDPDREVREAVLGALVHIGDDVAAGALAGFFDDPNPTLRMEAVDALEQIGTPMAIALIGELFQHPDAQLRRAGIQALNDSRFEEPEAVAAALENFFHDPVAWNQKLAIEAVAATGHGDSVAALFRLTQEQEVRARREAVWALSRLPDASAVAALRRLIHDHDMVVRSGAFRGLARQGGTEAYAGLLEGLDDPMEMVRISVIRSIADLKLDAAVPRLAERMKVADLPEQGAIIDALLQIGTDDAMSLLADLAQHGTEEQRLAANNALQHLNEREMLEAVFADARVSSNILFRRHH